MRRCFVGSAIAASVLLAGCSAAANQAEPSAVVQSRPSEDTSYSFSGDSPDPSAIVELPQPISAPIPVLALIPGIGPIPVVPMGVAEGGQAELPQDVAQVGWYRFGSAPGDGDGSVVLSGHRDRRGGKGALYDLPRVPVGTVITVTDASDAAYRYLVTASESISKQAVPLADLFVRDGAPKLILISCGGPYVKAQGGYQDNVVVTAERI